MADTDVPVSPDNSTPPPDMMTPDSMGGGVPDVGQPTSPDVSQAGATNVLAGGTPSTPSQIQNQAAAVHHSRLARSLDAVGKFLGGDTSYHITTNPDGSVDATPSQSTPGERWGRIAQAALAGAAKGFAVGQGPGGAQRAAAAGIQTGMALPQAQQDQTMALAQKMNDQNQQKQLFNANIAYLNTRNLEQSWQLDQNKKAAIEHDEAGELQFNQLQKQLHMQDLGPAANVEQAATLYNGNPQVQQALVGKGGQLVIHHPASGPPHAYIIPEDKLAQLNPSEQVGHDWSVDPKTLEVVQGQHTISANTETGLQTAARIAKEQSDKLNAIKIATEAQLHRSQADKADKDQGATGGSFQRGEDENGNPIYFNPKTNQLVTPPSGVLPAGTAAKREAATEKLQAAQNKELGGGQAALNYANDYVSKGAFTGTSDEALMDKFFEMAKPSSGFRMSQPQQQMLLNAQNAINSLKATITHKISENAPYFSPKLRSDIVTTMNQLGESRGIKMVNGRAVLPPVTLPSAGAGNIQIPEPIAPARPNAPDATYMGKRGTVGPNNTFIPADGSPTMQMPGGRAPLPLPKVGAVVNGRTFLGGDPALKTSWR